MLPRWSRTDSHGPIHVKNYLSAGLNMKEATLFKKYLGWTDKEIVGCLCHMVIFVWLELYLAVNYSSILYYKYRHRPMNKGRWLL